MLLVENEIVDNFFFKMYVRYFKEYILIVFGDIIIDRKFLSCEGVLNIIFINIELLFVMFNKCEK